MLSFSCSSLVSTQEEPRVGLPYFHDLLGPLTTILGSSPCKIAPFVAVWSYIFWLLRELLREYVKDLCSAFY